MIQTIFNKFNDKYGGKVIPNVGFCIGTYNITDIGDGILYPGDGASHFEVHATLMVFKPLDGEVFEGVIANITHRGIQVTLKYFDDIWIRPKDMFDTAVFESDSEGKWWKCTFSEDMDYFFDVGNKILCKFESVHYQSKQKTKIDGEPVVVKKEVTRASKVKVESDETGMGADGDLEAVPKTRARSHSTGDYDITKPSETHIEKKPMVVYCSCSQSGLGDPDWW